MGYTKRSGFTLVELLIVVAIMGVLSSVAAVTVSLVMKTSTTAMEQNREFGEVHMVGSWISRDVKSVKEETIMQATIDDTLCSMHCSVWNSDTKVFDIYDVKYLLNNGVLTRTSQRGSDPPNTIIIARFIAGPGAGTTYFEAEDTYFKLTITADYNSSVPGSVTRVYKISRGY